MNCPVIFGCTRQCASAGKPVTHLQAPQAIDRLQCNCGVGGDGGDADAIVPAPVVAEDFAVFTAQIRCLKSFDCRRVVNCAVRKQNFAVQPRAHSLRAGLQAKRSTDLIKKMRASR